MFTADYSSSAASTPIHHAKIRKQPRNETPELASTTPLAPPPSRPFGSSQIGSNVSKLRFAQNARDLPSKTTSNGFGLSNMTQDDYDDYTQDMDEDDLYAQTPEHNIHQTSSDYNTLPPNRVQSLMRFTVNDPPTALNSFSRRSSTRTHQYSILTRQGQEASVPGLARDLKRRSHPAKLTNDPDTVIIQTEQLLHSLHEEAQSAAHDAFDPLLASVAKELEDIWEGTNTDRRRRKDEGLAIGPGPGATAFENARFAAILILRLHNASKLTQDDKGAMSMPQILLDWLNDYHMTLEPLYNMVKNGKSNVAASEWFWDLIELLTARGKIDEVMALLADADFSYAKYDDGTNIVDADYTGQQQQTIQQAIFKMRGMLNVSPAVQSDDWYIDGPDWVAYRRDIEAALDELRQSAGNNDESELPDEETNPYSAVGSDLPFEVFQRLQTIYNIMLGSTDDIIAISQDWLEAAILLTVWWNSGPNDKVQKWSFDVSRANNPARSDQLGVQSYLMRLKQAFLSVTDPTAKETWQINSQSALELAVGLTLQFDLSAAISMIQTYSLCVSSALAEVGSWSGWLRSDVIPDGLGKEDLMVLTNGASNAPTTKDELLELYSNELYKRLDLDNSQNTVVDGWEIAISVVSRCDDRSLASNTVQQYIEELTVTTADRASRLVALCGELGLVEESRRVSEQYGDHLVNTSSEYGTALLCYAKSQAEGKVRQLVDLLGSYCLVQSRTYPPESEIDPALSRLVSNPKQALADISENDPQAVEILQFYLVGYACIRRFYTIRDDVSDATNHVQKKTAAKALVAAIDSAADCIYGGLYDPSRQSAIQVDSLLTLLGEATALLAVHNDEQRVFSSAQLYSLLAAIEHLQTVSDRVYDAVEECLLAAMRQAQGSQPPSPHAMLKKSISSGTNSNFSFSMMGSEMLAQSSESVGGKSMGSTVLVGVPKDKPRDKDDTPRGWDWRANFNARETTGATILQYLRQHIAEELSMANLEEGFR